MSREPDVTLSIDPDLIGRLASIRADDRLDAARGFPEALSRQQVRWVEYQIGENAASEDEGAKLKREALLYLGIHAMNGRSDLVTAYNIAKELKANRDYLEWGELSLRLFLAQRKIIRSLKPQPSNPCREKILREIDPEE